MKAAPEICIVLLAQIAVVPFPGATEGADGLPPGIGLQHRGYGSVLTDQDGLTLYIHLRDEPGYSSCTDECIQMWPPVMARPEAEPFGDWSLVTREDGSRQWAYQDQPLYRSLHDKYPGTANGEEFNGFWRAALRPMQAPPGFRAVRTALGHVLMDPYGLALYSFAGDIADGSGCDRACRQTWSASVAPAMAQPVGDWSIVEHGNGSRQWAFRSRLLYRYAGDVRVGQTNGHRVSGRWQAVVVEPLPPGPEWVTVRKSDAGEVYADADGQTLYALRAPSRNTSPEIETNAPNDWKPVITNADAQRVGDWAPIQRNDDTWQWTYKGLALFTNVNDVMPGDVLGVRSSDLRFTTITPSGSPMQGIGQ